jgi:ribosomal protein L18E
MKKHKKKIGRLRGHRTHGGGFSKKRRGTGSRKTNRRTFSCNISHVRKYEPWRINIRGFHALGKTVKAINIKDVLKLSNENEIDVTQHGYGKVLGAGQLKKPVTIKAYCFSGSAKQKIESAGGKAVIIGQSESK